jgi:hypothetical protein
MSNLFLPITLILVGRALVLPDRTLSVTAGIAAVVTAVLMIASR